METVLGFDPYDALRGRHVPRWVRNHRILRQAAIQLRKRMPFDLAPLYGVQPFVMAKAVACLLSAHSRRAFARGVTPDDQRRAEALVAAMFDSDGCLGSGAWGYEFDVQTRWAYYKAGTPNLIATVFAGHGLMEAGQVFARADWIAKGIEAASFARSELYSKEGSGSGPMFKYTPTSTQLIHNANLLGAGLLSAACLAGEASLAEDAVLAARTSVSAQSLDGRWAYGVGRSLAWSDNFHTAYNLSGLLHVRGLSDEFDPTIRLGAQYWTDRFFGADGAPGYYDDSALPYDVHSGATAVEVAFRLGLADFDDAGVSLRCAVWMRANLIGPQGRTWYRKHRHFTDRRHFVRWGDAHWDLATATEDVAGCGRPYTPWIGAR